MSDNQYILGIDLGTSNTCCGIWRNNNLEIIPDENGCRTVPSVVSLTHRTQYVGMEAKKQMTLNPLHTFYEIKRLIGRKIDDISIQNDQQFLSYKIGSDDNNNVVINTPTTKKTPEEISAMILRKIKHNAEQYLGVCVTQAVITVPAYFNDAQRQATKDAATIAGLDCIRIINEPTAAALAYGLGDVAINKNKELNIIVYDLGGGTLDVSLLNIADGVFKVCGSSGNTHLGGADFDNRLIGYCATKFEKQYGYENISDTISPISLQKLKQSCEEAKKRLSETSVTVIHVVDFYDGKDLIVKMSREHMEKICKDLFIMCLKSVEDVLTSCDMKKTDIDEIILVGGGTRMPSIKSNLKMYFGKEPNSNINPDEVVASGASIQGYLLGHTDDPFSENIVLLDIIPLSLGIETIGGVMNVIIPKNSVIPIKRKKMYTTDTDYEKSVNIKVYEGERSMTKNNMFVGDFNLYGIEPVPRGIPQIEITFSIDVNGIISVTAIDKKNKENMKTVNVNSNKGRLSQDEIKALIIEAKKMEEIDKLEKEKKYYYSEIEGLCANVIYNINDKTHFKLTDNDRQLIFDKINKILEWLREESYEKRDKKEYIKILEQLRKHHSTLIMKVNLEETNVQANTLINEGTTIYNDDDDDDLLEKYNIVNLDDEEFKSLIDPNAKEEAKRLRDMLVNLCYEVFDILTTLPQSNKVIEVKELVDEVLIWVFVKTKITAKEYQEKINEVNNYCNNLVESDNLNNIKMTKDDLIQMCYDLMSTMESNILCTHEYLISELRNKINEIFANIDNIIHYEYERDILNEMCDEIYKSMVNINLVKNVVELDFDSYVGTSIDTL